ncbi:MAG: nucleoside-triphosphatase [Candidatus Obscuribacterales bacterium]|nr:nucleoside-triphosphatase [Candidatus Obscuribacterales bacterium]
MKILLTAPPATGKSTVIEQVVENYPNLSFGIRAREMRDANNQRIGFTSINGEGRSEQFMFREADAANATVGGEYSVSVDSIDRFVVPELKKGLAASADALLYVDEIGRAQSQSRLFLEALRSVLDAPNNVLASIVFEDEPWSMEFKNRPDICLLKVDVQNRSDLPRILCCAYAASKSFRKLTSRQQTRVFVYLKEFVENYKFNSATKLFTNALPYVLEGKIEELDAIDSDTRIFAVHGQTFSHRLTFVGKENRFNCDCDLANGRGAFLNKAAPCSHQMSVVLRDLES